MEGEGLLCSRSTVLVRGNAVLCVQLPQLSVSGCRIKCFIIRADTLVESSGGVRRYSSTCPRRRPPPDTVVSSARNYIRHRPPACFLRALLMLIYCSCNQMLPGVCPAARSALMRLQENSAEAETRVEMWKVVDSQSTSHFQREMVQIWQVCSQAGLSGIISESFGGILMICRLNF